MVKNITRKRLRKFVGRIHSCRSIEGMRRLAKKCGLKIKFIGCGVSREVYLVKGADLVLKLSQYSDQSRQELRNILKLKSDPKLRPYLPKIYLYGCRILASNRPSAITMRYYPEKGKDVHQDVLNPIFRKTRVYDIYYSNIRLTKSGIPKLVDLGV